MSTNAPTHSLSLTHRHLPLGQNLQTWKHTRPEQRRGSDKTLYWAVQKWQGERHLGSDGGQAAWSECSVISSLTGSSTFRLCWRTILCLSSCSSKETMTSECSIFFLTKILFSHWLLEDRWFKRLMNYSCSFLLLENVIHLKVGEI